MSRAQHRASDRCASLRSRAAPAASLLLVALLFAFPADAQEQKIEDVFGDLGSASAKDDVDRKPGEGTLRGQVFDAEAGAPVKGVSVIVAWPSPADGSKARQEFETTGADGAFEFPSIPPGVYSINFIKAGYRSSTMTGYEVKPDTVNLADFPMPPLPTATSEQILELDDFVVEASTANELMQTLELRLESDELLNVVNTEDLAKFAAGDVAEALKRVAGVNVVEGQFAIIRGLEDRYSSTLYNGGPVPSPDPDRQSVQLDLFPSDVVNRLVVAKTFSPTLPSNSAGGAIDIVTHDYPEEFEFKLSAGSGFEQNARERFLALESRSPIGTEIDDHDVLESDYNLSLAGRRSFLEREVRYKLALAREIDYGSAFGFQESREPERSAQARIGPNRGTYTRDGDLSLGVLSLTGGRYELTQSTMDEQSTSYFGFGFDLDPEGAHRLDMSVFLTRKEDETVQLKENGWLPGCDMSRLQDRTVDGSDVGFNDFKTTSGANCTLVGGAGPSDIRALNTGGTETGAVWYANFNESRSFETDRDLSVHQINGDHEFDFIEGLHVSWAASNAKTTQSEGTIGTRYWYEPDEASQSPLLVPQQFPTSYPSTADQLASPGAFYLNESLVASMNDIDERQGFGRLDVDYSLDLQQDVALELRLGGWMERATRDVGSSFLESPTVVGRSNFSISDTDLETLGKSALDGLDDDGRGTIQGTRQTSAESLREIRSWSLDAKTTLWKKLDLLSGFRVENIHMQSNNDAFTGELAFDGSPGVFPNKWLFFDRLDTPPSEISRVPASPPRYNDELLGVQVPVDPNGLVNLSTREEIAGLLNGEIDENYVLPALGLTFRATDNLTLRAAYSQTVARPSFREMGYYVSTEPGSDDLVVGNPQLKLSDVASYDTRAEYTWGDFGDVVAVSYFRKKIQKPIESIIVRDPTNFDSTSSALFRTFFNNPSDASVQGVEIEARKNLGFLGHPFLEYFSIGGNYTRIDATVDRTQAELERSIGFFGVRPGVQESFPALEPTRRLFGQPEWIVNYDISFDNPEWGTKITLAWFAISDVLDAAGTTSLSQNGDVVSLTLDRYIDEFDTLDLVMSQEWGDWTFKASIKNLTDSERGIVYDREQTGGTISERRLKVGRDYSFAINYAW